jgi:hypothetical protein
VQVGDVDERKSIGSRAGASGGTRRGDADAEKLATIHRESTLARPPRVAR